MVDVEGKSPLPRWKFARLDGKGELSEFSQKQVFFVNSLGPELFFD
jgi:hypothetical protein